MVIFGTRPEAIKMAPIVKRMTDDPDIEVQITVTAQHREMLDQILKLFQIVPNHDLNIMQPGQSLTDIAVRALRGLEPILQSAKPDIVLVHGDTLTSVVGSLAAFFQRIPVAHVEAGLRTDKRYDPFPEEMNRRLTSVMADLHFAPTPGAKANLIRENVPDEQVFVVGNTVIDALLSQVSEDHQFVDPVLQKLEAPGLRTVLVTTHRRENIGEPMRRIFTALLKVLEQVDDIQIILPMHRNPEVRKIAFDVLGAHPRVSLIEPPAYHDFVNLMARCHLILTDSGGIQEEAPSLGRPVLVLRETTERPEGLEAGTCKKVGTQFEDIVQETVRLLSDDDAYQKMARATNPYGDGHASERIVEITKTWLQSR